MGFDFDAPEEIGGGGNYLEKPGTYHVIVSQVLEEQASDGSILTGGFTVAFDALEGTVREANKCTEIGKSCNLTMWPGKLTDKDKGVFAKKKQAAILIAANTIQPSDLGRKGLGIDLQKMVGYQFVISLESAKNPKFLQLAGAKVYHVDDPRIVGVPKDANALNLVHKEFRHDENWFAWTQAKPAAKEQVAVGAGTEATFDDL